MSAALGDGLLELRFAVSADGGTGLVQRAQRFPLRTTVPLYLDPGDPGIAFVYVQNPTGGLFAGDDLQTSVVLEADARVHVTTPAATKVYRMETGEARQTIRFVVGPRAYVEYVPEPLIPQRGSALSQEITVELSPGAIFLGVEALFPGRLARGEAFAYDRVRMQTAIRDGDGCDLCIDTFLLEPARRRPSARGLLGHHHYIGSLLAATDHAPAGFVSALDESVGAVPGTLAAAGELPSGSGAVVRILAESPQALRQAIESAWTAARGLLIGLPAPPRRK